MATPQHRKVRPLLRWLKLSKAERAEIRADRPGDRDQRAAQPPKRAKNTRRRH